VAVCTDSDASIRAKMLVQRLLWEIKDSAKKIIKSHSIIYQQELCSKVSHSCHVMSVVVSIVNFIHSKGEMEECCRIFILLSEEIVQFFENYSRKFPELHEEKWNNGLYFLFKITCHSNELNFRLKEKAQPTFEMITALKYFKK
jgi:hypothetical protein